MANRNPLENKFKVKHSISICYLMQKSFDKEENGTKHYSIVDIINLKDSIDWKVINRQVESLSFEEEE